MKKEKSELKTKIIDWFIITRIRILNFIKEHKYLSVGIGTFIFSCIVLLVAFAETDNYENEITVSNTIVERSNVKEGEEAQNAKSFSTIDYNVRYKLETEDQAEINRTVVIIAEFPENIDANWKESNENNTYELLAPNKLKIIAYNKKTNIQNTEIVKLNINNVVAGTTIAPTFTIYEATANIEDKNKTSFVTASSVSVINEEKVNLMAKVVSGAPYKVNSFEGRYVPYGIIVGIDKNDLNNGTLEGIYFEPSIELPVRAEQQVNGLWEDAEIINDDSLYGVYDKKSNKYFVNTGVPHYITDSNYTDEKVVFDSGNVTLGYGTAEKKEKEEVKVGTISLLGEKEITVTQGVPYENSIYARGILIGSSNEEVCATKSNADKKCSIEVKNEAGTPAEVESFTNTKGIYTVLYKYESANGTITAQRKVVVAASSSEEYELIDGNKITLYVGDEYKEPGIIKDGEIIKPVSTVVMVKDDGLLGGLFGDDWKPVTDGNINTSEPNEYKITYTLDDEELTRTVIVENINKTTSPSISAKNMQLPVNVSSYTPTISIDGTAPVECSSTNGCSFKYDRTFDTTKSGTYNITYTVNKDDFIITLNGYIHVALGDTAIKINNIKSNGKIYYSDEQMIGLGSYYVTVSSSRNKNYEEDIPVQFYVAGEKVSESTNLYFDPGVLNITTTLNEYDYGTITELSENDYLSYGDDNIVLRYLMEYPYGDTTKQLSVNIPVQDIVTDNSLIGIPFEIMKYYSAEENQADDFYLSGIDASKATIKYVLCRKNTNGICDGEDTIDKTTIEEVINSYSEGYILKNIVCDFKNINPGTTIDFRTRLKITTMNAGKSVNIKTITKNLSDSNYDDVETSTGRVNITAFKARSKVLIGETEEELKEQDKTVDGANVSYSTIAIYPSVTMPAANVTTNIIGATKIDKVNVSIELPSGVNFVYNDNYIKPSTTSTNKITYEIKGQQINEWIEPIYLNVSYDINIPVGTLDFKVVTQAIIGDITDSSTEDLRTTIRRVMYQNSAKVAVGQYTDHLSVSKEVPFNVITRLYNNTTEVVNNMSLVTVLPTNDAGNSKYSGIYALSKLPAGTLCSTEAYINDTKYQNNEVVFNDCSMYEEDEYLGVTAIKTDVSSLLPNNIYTQEIKIIPINNNTGDVYKVKGILITDEVVEANPLSIEVISKKISGTIWEDFDHNGLYDSTEKVVEGVTLTLIDSETGEEIDQTTSNAKGAYSFVDLSEGTYHIIAEYNTAKYGLSPLRSDIYDRSKTSSFEASVVELPTDCETDEFDCENCEGEDCDICELDCAECEDEYCEKICSELENSTCEDTIEEINAAKTKESITITTNTKVINNVNLGLTLKMEYSVKLTKYVTKAITTNSVGFATTNDFGKSKLAKLDVKDINKINIKVIYTIELENIGYYPGYIYRVKDYIPDGMTFNPQYEENKGWTLTEDGYIENNSLEKDLVYAGDKRYLTVAFDITRKEAGSFINYAAVEDEDLHILAISNEVGDQDEE